MPDQPNSPLGPSDSGHSPVKCPLCNGTGRTTLERSLSWSTAPATDKACPKCGCGELRRGVRGLLICALCAAEHDPRMLGV